MSFFPIPATDVSQMITIQFRQVICLNYSQSKTMSFGITNGLFF